MFWAASVFLGIGIHISVTVFIYAYIGDWCDEKLGTAPIGRISGLILGAPIAVWCIWYSYKNFDK